MVFLRLSPLPPSLIPLPPPPSPSYMHVLCFLDMSFLGQRSPTGARAAAGADAGAAAMAAGVWIYRAGVGL